MPKKPFGAAALSTIAPAVMTTLYETPNNISPAGLIVTLSSLGKFPTVTFASYVHPVIAPEAMSPLVLANEIVLPLTAVIAEAALL